MLLDFKTFFILYFEYEFAELKKIQLTELFDYGLHGIIQETC